MSTKQQVERENRRHPYYGFALALTDHLYCEHGYGYQVFLPSVFRNMRRCYHHQPGGKHQIVWGYQSVDSAVENGFLEYKSIQWVWSRFGGRENLKDHRGVRALALHEFAHVLQTEVAGGRIYGSVHNAVFVAKLRELQDDFPFRSVEHLIPAPLPAIATRLPGFGETRKAASQPSEIKRLPRHGEQLTLF